MVRWPLLIASCFLFLGTPPSSEARLSISDRFHVFSQAQSKELRKSYGIPSDVTPPYWQPSDSEIAALDTELHDFLARVYRERGSNILTHYDDYRLQVVGYSNRGNKYIYIHSFRYYEDLGFLTDKWREDMIIALDGGDNFFCVSYSCKTRIFFKYFINGEA